MITGWNRSSQQSNKLKFIYRVKSCELGSVTTIISELKTELEKKPKTIDTEPSTVADNTNRKQTYDGIRGIKEFNVEL